MTTTPPTSQQERASAARRRSAWQGRRGCRSRRDGLPLLVLALSLTCCGRTEPDPSTSTCSPASRAIPAIESHGDTQPATVDRKTSWAGISVDQDSRWDAANVADTTVAETDAVREAVLASGLVGLSEPSPPIHIHHVVETARVVEVTASLPRSERVLRWRDLALLRPQRGLLIVSRRAEIDVRLYMTSLAILMAQPTVRATWHLDAVARWLSGLALGLHRKQPFWQRGRICPDLLARCEGASPADYQEAVGWALSELPGEGVDLDYEPPAIGRGLLSPLRVVLRDGTWQHREPIELRHRALTWFVVFFLASFDVTQEGRVLFSGRRKHDGVFGAFASRPGLAYAALDPSAAKASLEIDAFQRFIVRKSRLGHARSGIVLSCAEAAEVAPTSRVDESCDLLR